MLELLVSLRRTHGEGAVGGAVKPDKNVGDVICAKLSPAIWSENEYRHFLIVKHEDAALEAKVVVSDGVLSLPFSSYDVGGNMVNRSDRKVNVAAFADRAVIALDNIPEHAQQNIQKIQNSELV